jgi:RNA recognition motif-containing protein
MINWATCFFWLLHNKVLLLSHLRFSETDVYFTLKSGIIETLHSGRKIMKHTRLYVGDIATAVTQTDLQSLFSQAGAVTSINLVRANEAAPHAFAHVQMASPEAAREAVQRFNGYEYRGSRLIVYTVPPQSRPRTS